MASPALKLTIENLTTLDNYGHKELKELSKAQLNEYATLLEAQRKEVLSYISKLN